MFRHFVVFLAIAVSTFAHAAQTDDVQYQDWNSVVELLRSRGIDASKIGWPLIESACYSLRSGGSDSEYNKCRFNKALDQNQYGSDQSYCNSQSELKYYEYLKPTSVNGVNVAPVNLNANQIVDFKNAAYISCMRGVGWNNPDSWVSGRRDSKH